MMELMLLTEEEINRILAKIGTLSEPYNCETTCRAGTYLLSTSRLCFVSEVSEDGTCYQLSVHNFGSDLILHSGWQGYPALKELYNLFVEYAARASKRKEEESRRALVRKEEESRRALDDFLKSSDETGTRLSSGLQTPVKKKSFWRRLFGRLEAKN